MFQRNKSCSSNSLVKVYLGLTLLVPEIFQKMKQVVRVELWTLSKITLEMSPERLIVKASQVAVILTG